MRETNLHDIPATLREIADAIEAGTHGEASGCVVVIESDLAGLQVFYTGDGEAGPRAHILLHAGAAKLLRLTTDG
jgi:hypothetical protein